MAFDAVRTPRLCLTRPAAGDLEDLQAMWCDPAVWEHFPSLRHADRATSQAALERGIQAWERDGLGWWVARSAEPVDASTQDARGPGALVGNGGCTLRQGLVWNLGYRLVRSAWGHGYAQEIITAARAAAAAARPELAVTAYLLEHNIGSRRSVERAGGFTLAWRGPDAGNPDPGAVRLLDADRPLEAATIQALSEPSR